MELSTLKSMLIAAAHEGALPVLQKLKITSTINKAQAYRLYGRSIVDRWVNEGLITLNGRKIDKAQIEKISASCNRGTYLTVRERSISSKIQPK
jgi:aspartate carbamoyltransferase regulatory subunit